MDFGANIKKARESKRLTQEELGEKIGVTGVTIMRYEKNKREPNLDMLFRLSDVLDVPVTFLAGIEEVVSSDDELECQYATLAPEMKINAMLSGLSDEDEKRAIAFIERLSKKNRGRNSVQSVEFLPISDDNIITINTAIDPEWSRLYPKVKNGEATNEELLSFAKLLQKGIERTQPIISEKKKKIEEIIRYIEELNEEGLQKILDLASDFSEMPKYQNPQDPNEDKE